MLLFSVTLLRSQNQDPQIVNSAGGSAVNGKIIFDWSFGELMAVNTFYAGNNFVVTTGFLQSLIDSFGNFLPIAPGDTNRIVAGPNPTHSLVTIRSTIAATGKILIRITNMTGNLVKQYEDLHESLMYQKQLNISALPNGTYLFFISFLQNNQISKTSVFRIIKM